MSNKLTRNITGALFVFMAISISLSKTTARASLQDKTGIDSVTQRSFLIDNTILQAGLGLLDVTLEHQILENNRLTPTETPAPMKIAQVDLQSIQQTSTPIPEHSSRPTPTPLVIPPPADPDKSKLIILGGIVAAIIVLIGVWINRRLVN
jgi:hypothetical protein